MARWHLAGGWCDLNKKRREKKKKKETDRKLDSRFFYENNCCSSNSRNTDRNSNLKKESWCLKIKFTKLYYETRFLFLLSVFRDKTNKFLVRFLFRYPSTTISRFATRICTRTRIFLRRESGILMRSPPPPTAESCRFRLINPHVSLEYIISSLSSLFLFLFRTRTRTVSLTRVTIGRFGKKERRSFFRRFHVSINAARPSNLVSPSFFSTFVFQIVQKPSPTT